MTTWVGDPPKECAICQTEIEDAFVDGKLVLCGVSTWASVCPFCALTNGVSLGLGKGQLFVKSKTTGDFVKVKG